MRRLRLPKSCTRAGIFGGLGPFFMSGTITSRVDGRTPRHRGILMVELNAPATVMWSSRLVTRMPSRRSRPAMAWFSMQPIGAVPKSRRGRPRLSGCRTLDGQSGITFCERRHRFQANSPRRPRLAHDDPDMDRAARPYTQATAPVSRQPVTVT